MRERDAFGAAWECALVSDASEEQILSVEDPERRRRLRAVEAAIEQYTPLLVGWLAKKFQDPEVARDIAQDAFLRVWRFAHDYPIDDPKALIFKTAANLAANEFRSRKRRSFSVADPGAAAAERNVEAVPYDAPSPERAECDRQDLEACRRALAGLPENARRAFVLNRFEELTYREIAFRLGVSESSVEKYIIRVLKTLRVAIGRGDAPEATRATGAASLSGERRKEGAD